jgi:hypothetical protein
MMLNILKKKFEVRIDQRKTMRKIYHTFCGKLQHKTQNSRLCPQLGLEQDWPQIDAAKEYNF